METFNASLQLQGVKFNCLQYESALCADELPGKEQTANVAPDSV